MLQYMRRDQEMLAGAGSLFPRGLQDRPEAVRCGSSHSYPRSHLAGPEWVIFISLVARCNVAYES